MAVRGLFSQVVLPYDEATRRIIQMLKNLGGKCQLVQLYCCMPDASGKAERETSFEVFLSLTKFFADTVQFLRSAGDISQTPRARGM